MRRNLVRKLTYMVLALVLFVLMFPTRERIERIRRDPEYRLSEETLASPTDVDTTGSIAILVLGGFRGVAANLLWSQALDIQKNKKDWNKLESVVQSIIKLQPHFVQVWTFQSWNLAWNVMAEWDAVEDKYYWIKRGIKFARRGTQVNEHSPYLRWWTGWAYFHRIGKSDEAVLFRRLYREDRHPEIDAQGREQPPFNAEGQDNYQSAHDWFTRAVEKCDELGEPPKKMGEVAFRSYPSHALTNFAASREQEGQFGEVIQRDWLTAYDSWRKFGEHEYRYADDKKVELEIPGEIYQVLYQTKAVWEKVQAIREKLARDPEEHTQGRPTGLKEDFRALFAETDQLLKDFGKPVTDILPDEAKQVTQDLRSSFDKLHEMDPMDLVNGGAAGDTMRTRLEEFADIAHRLERLADEEMYWSDRYASMINFRYWKERALAEAEPDTVAAREHFYKGLVSYREGDPEAAKAEFEAGLELWRKVLEQQRFAHVRSDEVTAEETVEIVRRYLSVLQQLDEPAPDPRPFEEYFRRLGPSVE